MSPSSIRAAVVIVAAGNSTRMGGAGPRKPLLALAGRTLLEHACAAFAALDEVRAIVVVAHAADLARVRALALAKVCAVVPGGAQRTDSVRLGVAAVPEDVDIVLVHDAARPLIRPAVIATAIAVAAREGAALVAVPVRDTLKSSPDGVHASATVERSNLWAAQTPQAFRAGVLREILARAQSDGFIATDDAALYERYVGPVPLVRGDESNLKITAPEDLALAEALFAARAKADHL